MSKSKEGWVKIKLQNHSKWHRRYCIIDWDKAVLFVASKADSRYKDWIKLAPNILINEYDYSLTNETNLNTSAVYSIEIKVDDGIAIHYLQIETKPEYDSWLIALRQTAYSRIGGGIFGQSLEDTYKYSRDKTSLVPLIVRQSCEYLLEYGSTFVGLFRVPGKQSSIKELRDMYDRGLCVELKSSYSPATISSLLKIYLQSLPEPIIPTKKFDDFLEIGSRFKYSQSSDLHRLKQLIETALSNINYAILAYLCLFLKKLTDYAQVTKMDTDNLAVVFGNNLIRPGEELDLNMIKGHSYNLLPLIKVLIDHSEYLFSNNSNNQFHDSYEQTTESVTKSSGFSSFSSLLSSNEHPMTVNSRSLSMPSICMATQSSFDSANLSVESQSEKAERKHRAKSFIENLLDKQSFSRPSTTNEVNHERFESDTHSVDDTCQENQSKFVKKRFASTDLLDTNQVQQNTKHNRTSMDNILLEAKWNSDIPSRPISTLGVPRAIRKMEKYPSKKGFVNKFGKSFSSIKSTMSKALQSHTSSNDNDSPTIDSSPTRQSFDVSISNNSLQNEIDTLKELLNKKDLVIIELTKTINDERLKFENEKLQLNQKIEQLQNENMKFKKQLNMQ